MGVEDAMEEDDDDIDFNPYLQLSPSLDGASEDSSDGEGEVEEADDDDEGEDQEESLQKEDLQNEYLQVPGRESGMEKDFDEDEFLELASDDYEEEEFEDEEQDEIVQGLFGNSEPQNHSTKSLLTGKVRKRAISGNRSSEHGDDIDGFDAGASDEADGHNQLKEADEGASLDSNLDPSRSSNSFLYEAETGRSMENLPKLRIFRRGVHSGEILRGDTSEDIGDVSVDAISKRTRAHYSLADMSLDQLEMFLQESDEEEYFQNVDDEEEYRKFLLAVQEKEVEGEEHFEQQGRKEDEDDEEEDGDFEFEIEEALESDYDDASGFTRKRKRRKPETRENRRQRAKVQSRGFQLSQSKAPLRPLLPHMGNLTYNGPMVEKRKIRDGEDQLWAPKLKEKVAVNGFTAHQIGQLYCLIHEHVQLLVQVYSMCVLEPTRQQVAIDTRRMLEEMAEKRELLLSWKKTAFPDFCFRPPYTHPSFTESQEEESETYNSHLPTDLHGYNFATCNRDTTVDPYGRTFPHGSESNLVSWRAGGSKLSTSVISSELLTQLSSGSNLISQPSFVPGSMDSMPYHEQSAVMISPSSREPSGLSDTWHQTFTITDSSAAGQKHHRAPVPLSRVTGGDLVSVDYLKTEWAPATSGPVRSLLDVAPLALVREFLNDMAGVAEDYRQRHVESGAYHSQCEREPLFMTSTSEQQEGDIRKNLKARPSSLTIDVEVLPVSAPRVQVKKTMAAALVESTKKESLALVPKGVANAVQRFLPYFNHGLFPHKPPPVAAANRLLFTDAEDELLAMGLMMYNTDWTAIQQRFLPSKSMHQIFVRQKNRSSARAPENSIKAVRRMKSSPLTAVEKVRIQEGLKIYKYDWNKVWEHCVPHRDPAVLPRQWRIALGTQKSYKTSETSKERRRVYEANRRQAKKASEYGVEMKKDVGPSSVETCYDGRDAISGDEDGFDGDAYIRDAFLAEWCPSVSPSTGVSAPSAGHHVQRPKSKASVPKKRKAQLDTVQDIKSVVPIPSSNLPLGSPAWYNPQTLRFGSNLTKQTVKLAPGLPSVKLPPHVHVLSQSLVPTILPPSLNNRFSLVPSRWSHIANQNLLRSVPVTHPRHLLSSLVPKSSRERTPCNVIMSSGGCDSNNNFLPAEQGTNSGRHAIIQQNELRISHEKETNPSMVATNLDLQKLVKDLDKKFGLSQPMNTTDVNHIGPLVRSPAEPVEISSPCHDLLSKDICAESSETTNFGCHSLSGALGGCEFTPLVTSDSLSPRRRKEKTPVVSCISSNDQCLPSRSVVVRMEGPARELSATTTNPFTRGCEELYSNPAPLILDLKAASYSSPGTPSKPTRRSSREIVPVHQMERSNMEKGQAAPIRRTVGKKIVAKRSKQTVTVKQRREPKLDFNKPALNKTSDEPTPVLGDELITQVLSSRSKVSGVGSAGGHRRRSQKRREETVEVEDPHLEPHGIVMEQEELNDSDDEADVGVEFEHEEMGDSDKDAEAELDVQCQPNEGIIEFEEEEIESDRERDSDYFAGIITERLSESRTLSAVGVSDAEILTRIRRKQMQGANGGQHSAAIRTTSRKYVKTRDEATADSSEPKPSRETLPKSKGKQSGRTMEKSKTTRPKSIRREPGIGSSPVQKKKRQEMRMNSRAREVKRIEAEVEVVADSDGTAFAAAQVLAIIHQVPEMQPK